jgi:hypothetical protein
MYLCNILVAIATNIAYKTLQVHINLEHYKMGNGGNQDFGGFGGEQQQKSAKTLPTLWWVRKDGGIWWVPADQCLAPSFFPNIQLLQWVLAVLNVSSH